jgi:hypothetical protein
MDAEELSRRYNAGERDFRGAKLSQAHLTSDMLMDADLSSAELRGAFFIRARLGRAILRFAHLSGTDLRWADLSGADLTDAERQPHRAQRRRLCRADADRPRRRRRASGAPPTALCRPPGAAIRLLTWPLEGGTLLWHWSTGTVGQGRGTQPWSDLCTPSEGRQALPRVHVLGKVVMRDDERPFGGEPEGLRDAPVPSRLSGIRKEIPDA